MKSETPEWKKEIAEKVKAYGERKKRLITPQAALKPNTEEAQEEKIEAVRRPVPLPVPVKKPEIKISDPVPEEKPASVILERANPEPLPEPKPLPAQEVKPAQRPVVESVASPAVEVWTEDLNSFTSFDDPMEFSVEEPAATGAPYTSRRVIAGIIDHTILIVLMIVFMGAFSLLTGESMELQLASPWRVTIPAFLICHCIYFLYFFRATRQTPGMVFLSLELRDPGSSTIPFGKVLARWIVMVGANIFNFVPVFVGKRFLLMDLISATEMRSFK